MFPRLTSLLDLSEEETKKYISDLVCKKTVYARIDRPARVVSFEMKRGLDEVLDECSLHIAIWWNTGKLLVPTRSGLIRVLGVGPRELNVATLLMAPAGWPFTHLYIDCPIGGGGTQKIARSLQLYRFTHFLSH